VLTREIGNDDVRGMEVRYDLLDDIERITGSVNEILVRKLSASSIVSSRVFSKKPVSACSFLVGDSPDGMMTSIRLVSFSVNRNVHRGISRLRAPRGTALVCIEAF
jgi:hypothetical protein